MSHDITEIYSNARQQFIFSLEIVLLNTIELVILLE
jgi:hypothetical protein